MLGAGSRRGLGNERKWKREWRRENGRAARSCRRGTPRGEERQVGGSRKKEEDGRVERLEPEPEAGSAGRRSDVDVGVGGGSDGGGPDMAEASRLPEVAEEMKCLPAS